MISWSHWHTEPGLVGGILLVVWLYALLVGPLREWLDPLARFPRREAVCFAAAVVSFYLAVGSPLDALGENFLFSAHMVQHNVLMYITPVFMLLALPTWLVDGLLNTAALRWSLPALRFFTHPLIAGVIFTLVFSGWHFPMLYEAALRDKTLHMVEHLTMLGSSVLMLWPILSPSRQLPRSAWGVQILYVFLLMVAQIPLFGILTFAPDVLYPTYDFAPRVIPWLGAHEDQVLGGLIMKVANMLLSLGVMAYAFVQWSRTAEPGLPQTHRGAMPVAPQPAT